MRHAGQWQEGSSERKGEGSLQQQLAPAAQGQGQLVQKPTEAQRGGLDVGMVGMGAAGRSGEKMQVHRARGALALAALAGGQVCEAVVPSWQGEKGRKAMAALAAAELAGGKVPAAVVPSWQEGKGRKAMVALVVAALARKKASAAVMHTGGGLLEGVLKGMVGVEALAWACLGRHPMLLLYLHMAGADVRPGDLQVKHDSRLTGKQHKL